MTRQSTDALPAATTPPGSKEFQGVIYYGIGAERMFSTTSKVIGLFDDDSCTEDIAMVLNETVTASRREHLGRYGSLEQLPSAYHESVIRISGGGKQ